MPSTKPPVRYQLSAPLQAVKLEEHPGSSLRDPTGTLVEIPAGAVLELEGGVARSGLINVLWNREAYSIFYEDLQEKAHIVNPAGSAGG
jgi:hypothetical protein